MMREYGLWMNGKDSLWWPRYREAGWMRVERKRVSHGLREWLRKGI